MKKVTIKGTEYNLKYSIRALFLFEQATGKRFEITTLTDEYLFLYCLLTTSNKDKVIKIEDLWEEIDDNPEIMKVYNELMYEQLNKSKLTGNTENQEGDSDVKKKS